LRKFYRKEDNMHDPFLGQWSLNPARSELTPHHRPTEATMTWQIDADGGYLMLAEGTNDKGQHVKEKPQKLFPDGKSYPVESLPGLSATTTRPDANTIRGEVRREDGSLVGEGTYVVADDGKTMTASTSGFDTQLRPFTMRTVWERR
jgi:hypothetical protein